MRTLVPLLVMPLVLAAAHPVLAQTSPATEPQPSADLRGLYAPMHHEAGLAIEPADSPETGALTGSARFSYAFRPVVLRGDDGEIAYRVIEHQLTGDIGLNIGLFGRLTLGLDLPLVLGQVGDDLSQDEEVQRVLGVAPVPITSLGDPALRAKVTIVKPTIVEGVARGFALGADERFTFPLGDERSFIAEGAVTSETRVLLDYGFGVVSAHLDAGVKLRGDTGAYACDPDLPIDDCPSRFGHEIPFVFGLALHPHELGIDPETRGTLFVETHGRIPVAPVTLDESRSPLSWYAGLTGRYRIDDVALLAAVEIGLLDGIGTAPFRGMLGVSFAPRADDIDKDGLPDEDDKCPMFAEDPDGFEQDDGCPEMDNDHDGVPDKLDACPDKAGAEGAPCPQ